MVLLSIPLKINYLGDKPSSLPNCTGDVVLKILSRNYSSGCSHSMPCYHKEYDIVEEYHHYDETLLADESMVYLQYNPDHLEEHQNSFIRVDDQTLIGHIGGLFGITLGWSGVLLTGVIQHILNAISSSVSFF